jgi:peptidoglycan hydrolase FlgJ
MMSGRTLPLVSTSSGSAPTGTLPPAQTAKLWKAAHDFEAMAIGQLLRPMFDTVDSAHGVFGGGDGEAAWRPMLVDAIGKQLAAHGGLGLATPMLQAQEQSR